MGSLQKFLFVLIFQFIYAGAHAEFDPLKKMAKELADGLSRHPGKKVAVLTVPYHDGRPSDGPVFVSEKLANHLSQDKRINVLERGQMMQFLSELHFSESGALDPGTAKKIGSVSGADVVITGTIIDLPENRAEVNVRGLLLDNGKILVASRAFVERVWRNRPVLAW